MVSPPPHLPQWAGSVPQTPPRRVSRHYHSQEGWYTTTKDYAYGDTTLCDKDTHYDDEYHEEVHSADDSDYEDHELFHAAEGAPSSHAPENHPYHELNNAFVLGASSDEADKDNGVPFLDSDEMAEHFYAERSPPKLASLSSHPSDGPHDYNQDAYVGYSHDTHLYPHVSTPSFHPSASGSASGFTPAQAEVLSSFDPLAHDGRIDGYVDIWRTQTAPGLPAIPPQSHPVIAIHHATGSGPSNVHRVTLTSDPLSYVADSVSSPAHQPPRWQGFSTTPHTSPPQSHLTSDTHSGSDEEEDRISNPFHVNIPPTEAEASQTLLSLMHELRRPHRGPDMGPPRTPPAYMTTSDDYSDSFEAEVVTPDTPCPHRTPAGMLWSSPKHNESPGLSSDLLVLNLQRTTSNSRTKTSTETKPLQSLLMAKQRDLELAYASISRQERELADQHHTLAVAHQAFEAGKRVIKDKNDRMVELEKKNEALKRKCENRDKTVDTLEAIVSVLEETNEDQKQTIKSLEQALSARLAVGGSQGGSGGESGGQGGSITLKRGRQVAEVELGETPFKRLKLASSESPCLH